MPKRSLFREYANMSDTDNPRKLAPLSDLPTKKAGPDERQANLLLQSLLHAYDMADQPPCWPFFTGATLINHDLWPPSQLDVLQHEAGLPGELRYSMSPKLALALILTHPLEWKELTLPKRATLLYMGLSPELDNLQPFKSPEGSFAFDGRLLRHLAATAPPTGKAPHRLPLRRQPEKVATPQRWLLQRAPEVLTWEARPLKTRRAPLNAKDLLRISEVTGVTVCAFIRYAAYELNVRGETFVKVGAVNDLMLSVAGRRLRSYEKAPDLREAHGHDALHLDGDPGQSMIQAACLFCKTLRSLNEPPSQAEALAGLDMDDELTRSLLEDDDDEDVYVSPRS